MITIADPTAVTIPQLIAMTATVIDQQDAVSEAYRAYRCALQQPAPVDPDVIPQHRDTWLTRKLIAIAAKRALVEVLTENGTPLDTPLKLVVKGETVTLRLFRVTEDYVSVVIVGPDWSA